MVEIIEECMNAAWSRAITHILAEGRPFKDDDEKDCLEAMNLTVTLEDPSTAIDGIRAMRRRSRKWRYPSEEELSAIMLSSESASLYDYLYGQRVFAYNGSFDQIQRYVIPLLRAKPHSRRATISLVNPERDFFPGARNVPGIYIVRFRIVGGKMTVTAVIRTSSFFMGWPANLYQISVLQKHVATLLALPIGSLTTFSMSAYLHTNDLEEIEHVLGKAIGRVTV